MANLKDYLDFNKIMLGVITYLIVDLHQSFKDVVRDVQELKTTVNEHTYRLNSKSEDNKKSNYLYFPSSEAIIPDIIKIKKENDKTKLGNS